MYGHEKVSVIDGGLPRARKEGVKLEAGPPAEFKVRLLLLNTLINTTVRLGLISLPLLSQETTYPVPTVRHGAVVGMASRLCYFTKDDWLIRNTEFDEVSQLAARPSPSAEDVFLIDARPASSYEDGHIPTSLLLDFPSSLLEDPAGFTYLRNPEELRKYIGERLGQDALDQITSQQVTVVNSEFIPSFQQLSSFPETQANGGGHSLWRWALGCDQLVNLPEFGS